MYNEKFCLENYLVTLKHHERVIMARFRCSSLSLPIEMGRRNSIPRSDRICAHCNLEIGDEYHYIFVCPTLNDHRKRFIPIY